MKRTKSHVIRLAEDLKVMKLRKRLQKYQRRPRSKRRNIV